MKTIQTYLQQALKKAGTQGKLALVLGIGQQAISSYLLGKRIPDDREAITLAKYLRKRPGLFLVLCQVERNKEELVKTQWKELAEMITYLGI